MIDKGQGITDIYNNYFDEPSILRKLHNKLDNLVLIAYGFSNKDDILQKLLELNFDLLKKKRIKKKLLDLGHRIEINETFNRFIILFPFQNPVFAGFKKVRMDMI